MREERLRHQAQMMNEKMSKRRQQQMSGFQGGGRPSSAAGRRRPPSSTQRQTALSPVDMDTPGMPNGRSSGIANPAFDEPEVTEVISNSSNGDQKIKKKAEVVTVQVTRNEATISNDIEKLELSENPPEKFGKDDSDIEELVVEEPVKVEKPKRKKREPKTRAPPPKQEENFEPENINPPRPMGALVREDTVLFPGDEYYNDQNLDDPNDEDITHELNDSMENLRNALINPEEGPEVIRPDIRPASRLSVQTTAASAGIDNIDEFAFRPAPQDEQIKCRISRDRKGIDNRAYPVYYLHLERDGQKKVFLLAGRKRKKSATSSYLISTDPTDLGRKSDSFVAKLRSNMMGTRFTCYDNGKAYSEPGALIEPDNLRKEMVTIGYETNVLGFKGPRKMTVVVPGMDLDCERVECQPTSEKETLTSKLESSNVDNITVLQNKSPVWNEDSQSYVLNFHGRVTQASVKNFQIVHEKEPDYIVMQFGRVEDDVFTMDYRYPLCAIQAFSIALSSFDNKLACE